MKKGFLSFPSELVEEVTYTYNDIINITGMHYVCNLNDILKFVYRPHLVNELDLEKINTTYRNSDGVIIKTNLYEKYDNDKKCLFYYYYTVEVHKRHRGIRSHGLFQDTKFVFRLNRFPVELCTILALMNKKTIGCFSISQGTRTIEIKKN